MKMLGIALVGALVSFTGSAVAQSLGEEEAASILLQEAACRTRAVEAYFDEPKFGDMALWASTDFSALVPGISGRQNDVGGVTYEGTYLDGAYRNTVTAATSPNYMRRGLYALRSCVVIPDYVDVIAIQPDTATQSALVEYVTHWKISKVGEQWRAMGLGLSSNVFMMFEDDAYTLPDLERRVARLRYRPETGWEFDEWMW